jgi:hypothetical protein
MKTLLTLFSKERSELETDIDKATSLNQVVQLVQTRLDGLEKNYIGELSVTQVRLVKFFLDTLRQSLTTLTAANETMVLSPNAEQIINQAKRVPPNRLILKILQGLLSLGILGTLFSLTQETPGAWTTILLMSVLVGLEVVLQFDKNKGEDSAETQSIAAPQLSVQVNSQFLLDNLADVLSTIDRAVAQNSEAKTALGSSGIEEMPEMLDFLQKLWGASFLGNPQMALEISKLVPQILMEQGIRVQNFRPNDEQSLREYFDFEPSIDPSTQDYFTLTPALLKSDRLLRRGRVIEPVSTKTTD